MGELFSFDELDRLEKDASNRVSGKEQKQADIGLRYTGWRLNKHQAKRRTVCGHVVVLSSISGDLLCTPLLADAVEVWELKAAIAELDGTPVQLQRLLVGSREVRDKEALSRVLSKEHPQVSLLRSYGEELISSVRSGKHELQDIPGLGGYYDLVLAAVRRNGDQLQHASEELRGSREVVLAAIEAPSGPGGVSPLAYATEAPRCDRGIVLAAVRRRGSALAHATAEHRRDREIVLNAVRNQGVALEHSSEELRGDRHVVREAVLTSARGVALQHAALGLRSDRGFALSLVRERGPCLEHLGPRLRLDREVVTAAVLQDYSSFQYAAEELRGDPDYIVDLLTAYGVDENVVWFASERVKGNSSLMSSMMSACGFPLF